MDRGMVVASLHSPGEIEGERESEDGSRASRIATG